MRRVYCDDSNGRKFSLLVKDDATVIDQVWIDRQNEARAKFLGRAAIVKWHVEVVA